MRLVVPASFSRLVVARNGAVGAAWLSTLPDVLAGLLDMWSCARDEELTHGQVGLIVPVQSPFGAAVIKISPPHAGNAGEAPALRHLAGRGTVQLYQDDPKHTAMLLERVEGPPPAATLTPDETVEMLGELARRIAIPGYPQARPLHALTDAWRSELEQQVLTAPELLGPDALARAFAGITWAAADLTDTVLHGDLHEGNVLGAAREPWLAIDPKGYTGTAAYDAWTAALVRPDELIAQHDPRRILKDRVRRFARAARVNEDLADAMAFTRLVSSLFYEAAHAGGPAIQALLADLATTW